MRHLKGVAHRNTLLMILVVFGALSAIGTWMFHKQDRNICTNCSIVLIIMDPLRADELPCYGYTMNTAPNLCRFANRNIQFAQMHSQSSWTLPSIMSLLTSQYPTVHGVFHSDIDVLPPETITLPMALKNAGYRTVFIGPESDPHVPLDKGVGRGFDKIMSYKTMQDAVERTIQMLQEKKNTPTFVLIHSFDLRTKAESPDAPMRTFTLDPTYRYGMVDQYLIGKKLDTLDSPENITSLRRLYDEIIKDLDKQLAPLLNTPPKNTIVAITSNHGNEFGEHGKSTHSTNLYTTTTHVPFILSIPGNNPTQIHTLAQSIDIYPTLLSLVGVSYKNNMQGQNLFGVQNTTQEFSISQLEPEKHLAAIRTDTWAYYFNPDNLANLGELYDRRSDSGETHNVALQHKDIIASLIALYQNKTK